jgi:ABC-type branched-subunit amino acid transport system substrate-binding protein
VSQVVPDPWNAAVPIVKEYQQAMGGGKFGFVSLEGYIAAKIFYEALQSAGSSIDSDSLKSAIESMSDFEIGGLRISFGPGDHRGMDEVYLTKIEKTDKGPYFRYLEKLSKPKE